METQVDTRIEIAYDNILKELEMLHTEILEELELYKMEIKKSRRNFRFCAAAIIATFIGSVIVSNLFL